MNTIHPLSRLKLKAHTRAPGWLEEILRVGKVSGSGESALVELTPEQFLSIRQKFNPRFKSPRPQAGEGQGEGGKPGWPKPGQKLKPEDIFRTPEQAMQCQKFCEACEFFSQNCCKKIIGCSGGLPRKWRLKNSHCVLPDPKW